ncbi:hypothetical protein BH10PSE17_BH10PSE17_05020 [soil metagenome]
MAHDIAVALNRVRTVLRQRPTAGLHDDAPATVRWQGGLEMIASHPNGHRIVSDMPVEMGGAGTNVTPGWMFRAGLAACAATCIAMEAAARGVTLTALQVDVRSRSDTCGLLGLPDESGSTVGAGPRDVSLQVRIGATDIDGAELLALVEDAVERSPVPCAVRTETPIELLIEVEPA